MKIVRNSSTWETCLFSPTYLSIQSFILYQDELMDIYFMVWVIIRYYIIYFGVQIVPALKLFLLFAVSL